MTKFVRIRIDLGHLDAKTRALVPHFGPNGDGPKHSRAGVKFGTQNADDSGVTLPSAFTVAVTLPEAVLKPHFALGTSVFAAGRVGLEFARIELARAGIPYAHDDNHLGIKHVSIETAGLSYLLPFAKEYSTRVFKKQLHHYALLLGLSVQAQPALNRTTYRQNPNHADNSALAGTAVSIDWRPTQELVCLHVELDEGTLKQNGWDSLESWHDAYVEARYEDIFNRVVRGMFRMDGELHEHPAPGEDKYDRLGIRAAAILRDYVSGREAPTSGGRTSTSRHSQMNSWRASRHSILEISGIDITKAWQKYRKHRPAALVLHLNYPGDFRPVAWDVSRRFCQENWQEVLKGLRDRDTSA